MKNHERVGGDRWNFEHADTKSFTHGYHIYPAMMIPQVARTLIRGYKPEGRLQKLLDPYMGSGTSLVEASLAGIDSVGSDLNPLARLIARVKTSHYDETALPRPFSALESRSEGYAEKDVIDRNFERITNCSYRYTHDSLLSKIVVPHPDDRRTVRQRRLLPHRALGGHTGGILHPQRRIQTVPNAREQNRRVPTQCFSTLPDQDRAESERTSGIQPDDMVVTSPPYGDSRTTVAYGQFSRWANEWFGFEHAGTLDSLLMGGKKSRAESFGTTSIREQLDAIRESDVKRYEEVVSFKSGAKVGTMSREYIVIPAQQLNASYRATSVRKAGGSRTNARRLQTILPCRYFQIPATVQAASEAP